MSAARPAQPTSQPTVADAQINLLQQQMAGLMAMMATSIPHPGAAAYSATASLSGYGTPAARNTPPVFQPGYTPETLHLGLSQLQMHSTAYRVSLILLIPYIRCVGSAVYI